MKEWNLRYIIKPSEISVKYHNEDYKYFVNATKSFASMDNCGSSTLDLHDTHKPKWNSNFTKEKWVGALHTTLSKASSPISESSNFLLKENGYLFAFTYHNARHRSEGFMQYLKRIIKCVRRWEEMQLDGLIRNILDMVPEGFYKIDNVRLPTCEMMHYLLLRLYGAFNLLLHVVSLCVNTCTFFKTKIQLVHSYENAYLALGYVARIRAFSIDIANTIAKMFDDLHPLVHGMVQRSVLPLAKDFHTNLSNVLQENVAKNRIIPKNDRKKRKSLPSAVTTGYSDEKMVSSSRIIATKKVDQAFNDNDQNVDFESQNFGNDKKKHVRKGKKRFNTLDEVNDGSVSRKVIHLEDIGEEICREIEDGDVEKIGRCKRKRLNCKTKKIKNKKVKLEEDLGKEIFIKSDEVGVLVEDNNGEKVAKIKIKKVKLKDIEEMINIGNKKRLKNKIKNKIKLEEEIGEFFRDIKEVSVLNEDNQGEKIGKGKRKRLNGKIKKIKNKKVKLKEDDNEEIGEFFRDNEEVSVLSEDNQGEKIVKGKRKRLNGKIKKINNKNVKLKDDNEEIGDFFRDNREVSVLSEDNQGEKIGKRKRFNGKINKIKNKKVKLKEDDNGEKIGKSKKRRLKSKINKMKSSNVKLSKDESILIEDLREEKINKKRLKNKKKKVNNKKVKLEEDTGEEIRVDNENSNGEKIGRRKKKILKSKITKINKIKPLY